MAADNNTRDNGAPLAGRSVVVTRAREQAASLVDALESLGADVIAFPVITFVEPPDLDAISKAIADLETYDWVVFASTNGVERFFAHLVQKDRTAEALGKVKIAAVGKATARCLADYGVHVDMVPTDFRAEGLLEEFRKMGAGPGWRVLIPRAYEGRELLPGELRALGVHVDTVAVYRTIAAEPDPVIAERLRSGVDAVTFTSPSTVRHFVSFLEAVGIDADALMHAVTVASIGPTTSSALRARGWEPQVEPAEYTVVQLAEALGAYYSG